MPAHDGLQTVRVAHQVVVLHHLDRGERGGARQRVRVVGEASVEHVVLEVPGDRGRDRERAERQVGGGQPFRGRHQVRHDPPVVHREPLARAPEPAHDLVGDQHDPVPGAELAHALQVAIRRDQDAVRAGHRLEDERGDRLGALEHDLLLEPIERLLGGVLGPIRPAVGVEDAHDPRHGRVLVGPPSRIPGEVGRQVGGAVIRPVSHHDLLAPRVGLGDPDRVLVRLGPAQGEEGLLHVARPQRGELLAEERPGLVGGEGRDVGKRLPLLGDRVDHALVAVADVDAHQLRVEVEIARAVDPVEVDALGAIDGHRRDLGLRGPVVEGVALRQLDDLIGRQGHRSHVLPGVPRRILPEGHPPFGPAGTEGPA